MANVEPSVRDETATDRKAHSLDGPLADSVQAHFGRASKFADGRTRNWSLFYFFRIVSQAEFDGRASAARDAIPAEILGRLASLGVDALPRRGRRKDGAPLFSPPSKAFRAFLRAAVTPELGALEGQRTEAERLRWTLSPADVRLIGAGFPERVQAMTAQVFGGLPSEDAERSLAEFKTFWVELGAPQETEDMWPVWTVLICILFLIVHNPPAGAELFDAIDDKPGPAGLKALKGGLIGVCLYETSRKLRPAAQVAQARQGGDLPEIPLIPGVVRSESAQQLFANERRALRWDPCPANFAFTFAGLTALGVDPATLASFPDPFTEGMAARADRLCDTGPSAPVNWDGPLGVNDVNDIASVHGYFTGGFLVGDDLTPVQDALWQTLRDEVAAFNASSAPNGAALRKCLNDSIFWPLGVDVVHIEIGENPYEVDDHGDHQRTPYRKEHFGFADGVSQPFLDLGDGILCDPPPGGGTPAPNRTWAPVAPGEIFLSEPDGDGLTQTSPVNELLRKGSTYVVFRKLEQRVPEFRAYLARQRPDDEEAQLKLAAEFVGRWPNGAPLVLAPDREIGVGPHLQETINDFLYAADDPKGRRCPLGAHARRTNPRDTGGRDQVRRHRILRRSISYGGPLLPPGSEGDGRKRGLLFIALNARLDLQFELIQDRWINAGEILGQAGLNRCPLTGANRERPDDAFLEAGAVAPVAELPRFVMTRGGDYFFAPGIDALIAIALGCTFPPDAALPFDGYSMDDAYTPSLFNPLLDPTRLKEYAYLILSGQAPVIRATEPLSRNPIPGDPAGTDVVFVALYDDVKKVLSTVADDAPLIYSVAPYREMGRRVTRGHDLIEGTEPGVGSQTANEHTVLHNVLDKAWTLFNWRPIYPVIRRIIKESLDLALRRVAKRGAIDLVSDLALASSYQVVSRVFGIPGPEWVTELAVALPFYFQHVGELLPGWLDTVKTPPPPIPGLATLQTWSVAVDFDFVANYEQAQEVIAVTDQAAGEFLEYLDALLATARADFLRRPRRVLQPTTLVEAFVMNEGSFVGAGLDYPTAQAYYLDVATLLMGLAAAAIGFIPSVFGFIMQAVLDWGLDLPRLIPILTAPPQYDPSNTSENGVDRLIFEICRLHPPVQILMRACVQDDVLPSGGQVYAGDFIATMVGAAGLNDPPFTKAKAFSLYPFLPGPPRDIDDYLLFGVRGGGRECWGRDKLALLTLAECIKAAGRLQKLRRAAGAAGALRTNLGTDVGIALGLQARFDYVLPDWP